MNVRFAVRAYDPALARRLVAGGLHPALGRVYAARGLSSADDLILRPQHLLPPSGLHAVDNAAALLADAIREGRWLRVIADYDCDGATACAVAVRGLRMMGARVDYLVPNRFKFGYGLTPEIVDLAAGPSSDDAGPHAQHCAAGAAATRRADRSQRPDLLITVDNGIASVEGVARATELGIDVLVTDHHLPGPQLPAARCIVNPNQPGCGFPSKHLAGVGVIFYVLTALRAELRRRGVFSETTQPRLDPLLDLVALGTVADVVRLDRNNRILVAAGLTRIRAGRMQAGIGALFQVAGKPFGAARASDLGFAIGPRINAAGRLDDMSIGIECLLTDDSERALALAGELDRLNRERRDIEADMQFDALADLDAEAMAARRTITLFQPQWHPGVVGLVASRVKERFFRPTVAFAAGDDGLLRGSGRSIEGVHLRDVLDLVTKAAPRLIHRFGGHSMAAGLTLAAADWTLFADLFERVSMASTDAALYRRMVDTDGPLRGHDIDLGLVGEIDAAIWGQGFTSPLFANEFHVLEQRLIKNAHLKLTLALDGQRFAAIWFRRTEPLPDRAMLAYRPVADVWQGQARLQLHIEHAAG